MFSYTFFAIFWGFRRRLSVDHIVIGLLFSKGEFNERKNETEKKKNA